MSLMDRTLKCAAILLVSILWLQGNAVAQLTAPSGGSGISLSTPSLTTTPTIERSSATPSPDALIFDGVINPREYRMGPGDILQMRLWASGEPYSLMVSPENILIIPRLGEFNVQGKTLEQLRDSIKATALQIFKGSKATSQLANGPVSVTLLQPRRILVKVKGEVHAPNVYTLTAGNRADVAVELANKNAIATAATNVTPDVERQRLEYRKQREANRLRPYLGTMDDDDDLSSLRYITVAHADGTSDHVDLVRYNTSHDPRFSPLLREGDVVYVPLKQTRAGEIGVYGAVEAPGLYEFVEGDSLSTMIEAAYGATLNADLSRVELSRTTGTGEDFTTQTIDLAAVKAGRAGDVRLKPGDRIFIRERSEVQPVARVTVRGEVMRPGVYPIKRTDSKLSDIIKAAGGFTPYAFLKGASVVRKPVDNEEKDPTPQEEALQVNRLANLNVEDTANFKLQSQLRDPIVTVDMDKLFKQGDASADITLQDGDVINVPQTSNTVYVWGYVGKKGFIAYKPNEKAEYYIAQAGGYAEGAVESGTRVIKAQTRQWVEPDETTIDPGDEVYVPKHGDFPQGYTLNLITAVGYLTISVASLLLAILRK